MHALSWHHQRIIRSLHSGFRRQLTDVPQLPAAAVERHLTQQEHAEQLRQVQSMWQMAAILEFLHTFSLHLRLRGSFTPEELEVAIVSETAQTGLLANLHQVTTSPTEPSN